MISKERILAWKAQYAPWSREVQIEQDLILSHIMGSIFEDPYLHRHLAMRGGTVLHKVHLAPASRYSEDIDLVLVREAPIKNITTRIRHVLSWLGQPTLDLAASLRLTVRNLTQPSKIARMVYRYAPTTPPPLVAKVKIEINYSEKVPVYGTVERSFVAPLDGGEALRTTTIRSYDIDEMLGTKMRALLQRAQGRDLFDLSYSWNCHQAGKGVSIDPGRVVHAFYSYMAAEGTAIRRSDYQFDLEGKVRIPRFRTDMESLLRPGMEYDVDAAASTVREVFVSRLT